MTADDTGTLSAEVGPRDHVQGLPAVPVTLVEYGDYECSDCGRAHAIVKAVQCRLGAQLRFVFRHFSLRTIHPHAERVAEAAEAAAAQGRFWEMRDQIFGHQRALDADHLRDCAAAVGLDRARFENELTSGVHRHQVREDFSGGVRSGVNGTPTFFVNGRRYDGSWDEAPLADVLRAAISVAG